MSKKPPVLTNPGLLKNSDASPIVFQLHQSAAWDWAGYPIFVRRIEKHPPNQPHSHAYFEIVLVETGTADHVTAGGIRKLHSGDIIVMKPGAWHQYQNPRNFQIVNCLFDRGVLKHHHTFLSLLPGVQEFFFKTPASLQESASSVLHASPARRTRFSEILHAMMRERTEKHPDWEAAMIVHLLNVIICISRLDTLQKKTEESPDRISDFMNGLIEFLESHSCEPISLEALSKRFHVSPSYLSRLFSKRMGMGLVDYIHHLRIEEACRLLCSTDWSISRIAGEVGYDEFTYFSRRFRREAGMTPKEYRQKQAERLD